MTAEKSGKNPGPVRQASGDEAANTPVPIGLPDAGEQLRAAVPGSAAARAVGFRAEVSGGSLWELVQRECEARGRRVVQVRGDSATGYLYFAGGRVIHAVAPGRSGEAAALEILSWKRGAFAPCERGWPAVATIDASYETLLLRAVRAGDEAAAPSSSPSSNLVAFRGRGGEDRSASALRPAVGGNVAAAAGAAPIKDHQRESREGAMPEMRTPNNNQPTGPVPITRNDPVPDFAVMIRVGANGAIIKNKGGNEDLAGVVAYTQRMVELVGELLGLDRFIAMECVFKDPPADSPAATAGIASRYLVFTEANGDTVALRPRADSNIQPLRESLGL